MNPKLNSERGIYMRRALTGLLLLLTLLLISAAPLYAYVEDIDISYYRVLRTNKVQHQDAAKVEEIIRYFADAMYEASNGEVQIGTVRIFQGASQHITNYRTADIVWEAEGHPSAMPGAGASFSVMKYLSEHINMYDVFTYGGVKVSSFLDNPNYGGYALASLASSYLFGLRSEYPFTSAGHTFTGTKHATIMKDPAEAAAGNVEALNYSVKSMYTEGITTEQSARWDESAWDYLTSFGLLSKAPKGKKSMYSIETEANKHSLKALSKLKIVWISYPTSEAPEDAKPSQGGTKPAQEATKPSQGATKPVPGGMKPAPGTDGALSGAVGISSPIYMFTIDVSGSMQGERFSKVIAVAKDCVKAMSAGRRVGINIFSDSVSVVSPIVTITAENEKALKTDLLQKIDAIGLQNNTAMYDGCAAGIADIIKQPNSKYEEKWLILLSDGLDNCSHVSLYDVIKLANANSVKIWTFALDDGVDWDVLQKLAEETGVRVYGTANPTDIKEAMNHIRDDVGAQSSVQDFTVKAGGGGRSSFYVEPGASEIRAIALTDKTGTGKSLKITARSPKGKNINVPYSADTDEHEIVINKPEQGVWTIDVKNSSKNDIYTRILSYTNGGGTMIVPNVQAVNALDSSGILIYASVSAGGVQAAGLKVTGTLTGNGVSQKLEFNDASMGEDALADDGIYTCLYNGDLADGNYRIAVSFDGKNNAVGSTKRLYMLYPGKDFKADAGSKISVPFERAEVSVIQVRNGKINGNFTPVRSEKYVDYARLHDKLDLAEKAMKRGDYKLAHDYITEAKRIAPEDRRVFFLNGKIYDAKNSYADALEEYRNAMLLAPNWSENYYRYGQALANLGEQQQALFVLERMQYLFPKDPWTDKMEVCYNFAFH